MTDVRTAGGRIPGEPGNWQIEDTLISGDWGTRGPGVRATFRFTATESFFTAVQNKWGPEVLRSSKSITFRPFLVLWGPNRVAGPPFPAVFKVQRRFPRNLLCSGDSPPGTFGVFFDRRTRQVPRPLFQGDEEVGKLGDPAKGIWGERLQTTREEDFIKNRKEER